MSPRVWQNAVFNFDDVYQASSALFILANLENWSVILFNTMDIVGVGKQPQVNYSFTNAAYSLAYVFIWSYYFFRLVSESVYRLAFIHVLCVD